MHGTVKECEGDAELKGEAMQESGGMRREIIFEFSIGEDDKFVSTISSRHLGMTDIWLEMEVTEGESTMISCLRSRMSTFPILMGVIPMTGWVGPGISSMSTRCRGRQGSALLDFTWRAWQGSGGEGSSLSLNMTAGDSSG